MRSKLFFLTILPLFFLAPLKCFSQSNLSTADEVLRKTSAKLASLKTLKYKYRQEYNYASESYFRETSAEGFLDFAPVESVHGLRFQFTNQDIFIAYNGSESFNLS
nr:hypothetical protein [Pyrinomonadaceae bacterium]